MIMAIRLLIRRDRRAIDPRHELALHEYIDPRNSFTATTTEFAFLYGMALGWCGG